MIDEWLSYSLNDLLIFSYAAYIQLYAHANTLLWPYHFIPLLCAILALSAIGLNKIKLHKLILLWLALSWIFVSLWFLRGYYLQINPLAEMFSYLFIFEAILLILSAGVTRQGKTTPGTKRYLSLLGWILLIYAYLVHSLLLLFMGRQFAELELVSVAPDPTAIATVGFLLIIRPTGFVLGLIVPIAWLVLSALTYYAF